MKREGLNYKLFIFLCITFFHSLSSFGYDAEVNGIYYNFSGTTATVTYPSQGTYTGSVVIPETVTYKDVTYNVKKIGYEAFAESSGLTSITIPNSVTSIEFLAFYKCSGLTSITIPNSVTNIEHEVFWLCSGLTSITIPNSVTSIKDGTFYGCSSITSFSIPNSVTSIGSQAFYYCSSLTSITIPSNVTSIGTWAFGGCSGLSDVISGIKEPFEIDGTIFKGIHSDAVLTVPNGTRDKYLAITGWTKHFKDVREQEGLASTYTLSVKATGNGSASYNGQAIKNSTTNFTINEGTSATISFSPDSGYKIKSVKMNDADVTSSVYDNSYTISNISANTTLEVEFEAIPPTTYTLSIKVIGNGSVSYNGTSVRYGTTNFSVNSGSNATVKFYPDDGYRIKSVKVNNSDVTSSVSNDQYTISNISSDTTLEVEYEADTYNLSIKVTGNGSVSFNGITIKNQTYTVNVNGGSSLTISFTPDSGYRIKSVKVNDTDVTSSVSSNAYTINNISANTTLEVEFEAIPATTYTLSIIAVGNGSASYNGSTIKNQTSTFAVNEGTSATVTFNSDNGYRIKSVKLNSADVTSSVSSNKYTINNIAANTTLEVEFEAIPATTYTLSIKATGNGSASYNGSTIKNQTSTFAVNEGTSATITFNPDNGYRIKSVKLNSADVTSSVSSNQYTINNIAANTNLEVEFEAIPATTYTLFIIATGNGYVSYNGTSTRNETNSFTVNEGDNALLMFVPESGYRLASVKVNYSDVTYWIYDNQYTISNISSNTTVEVTFEAIPIPTYSLSITASGNGSATYNGTSIRNRTTSFTVDEGTSATITFTPDNGNSIASVKLNNSDVTSQVSGNRYTISNITANTTLSVTFQEDVNALTVDGLNYTVTSQSNRTVTLTSGGTGLVLTVPATITQNGTTWKVTGIDKDALKGNTELAAIIWNPEAAFTATVSNPNLLLYVKSSDYAPSTIQNVVVNGTASNIILAEAKSGNNFYCPQSFVAQKISYTHNYKMQTGIGEARGWETIALPFDVQKITHATKGEIKPFTQWKSGDSAKPFWLYELAGTGFVETGSIKAYTPYIISMPNNPQYDSQWLLNGKVTFAASSVTIGKTENLSQPTFQSRSFIPCFAEIESDAGVHALNVNNDFETNNSGMTEGSRFVLNMRSVHPFEAYMKSSSSAPPYAIGVFEDMTTGIQMMINGSWTKEEVVYDLQGRKVNAPSKKGVYIINGKKKIIR